MSLPLPPHPPALLPDPFSTCPSEALSEEKSPVLMVKVPWKKHGKNCSEECSCWKKELGVVVLSRGQNVKSASCSLIRSWKTSHCSQGPEKALDVVLIDKGNLSQ